MLSNECHEETIFSFSCQAPGPPERRRDTRHFTILRVGALIGPEGRELCLIRNISAGGLMAHVYSHHALGAKVAVELRSHQPVPGTVVWSDQSNLGIEFETPIDVEEMLSSQTALDQGWQPRPPRVEVDRLATLRSGSRLYGVNTRDISQGGVKIETDQEFEIGLEVVLTMEKFRPLSGVVRWSRDGLAGIVFNQPIPFHELMNWLRPEAAKKG